MTIFEAGTRVRVTEQYAKNIAAGNFEDIHEVGIAGTIVEAGDPYIQVILDPFDRDQLADYMFYADELELV